MDQDVSRKRKRTSSNNSALSSKHVTENLHRYGENILHCTVNITRGIKEFGNGIVLKFVCALLNSGGGILHMKNLDAERGVVLSKHLDTWWSGMEIKMAEILSRDDICNYFDLVGNHDDHDLYLFVKTAEHLCSLCYHSRLPTDTATHEVTYQSMLRLLVSHGEPGSLEELPPIPDRFVYGRSAEELKKETKQIQFKLLTTPQKKSKDRSTLPEKIRGMMIRYVSAFANHEGGRIYFGIDDARASVIGEDLNQSEQKKTELLVADRMKTMIWRDSRLSVQRGTHWDIHFFPIEKNPRKGHNVVVVVSVCKFPGGVFTNIPDSSYVNTDGKVAEFSFDQWKEAVLNPLRDVPELHSRFLKVSLMVPRAPLVFTLPNTIETIKQKVLLAKQNEVQPRHYIESYVTPPFRESINKVVGCFNGDKSVCLGMECWGLKVPMEMTNDIICDIAIVTEADGIHILTFTHSNAPHVEQHSQIAANVLKNRLVHIGGCTEKFSVICHVVDLSQQNCADVLEREVGERDVYPSHFSSSARKFNKILNSFAICMGSYRAKSQNTDSLNQNGCYNFVLTHDQFELLWRQQFTKELWVHGPAGAGKTVAAVQMIQELRRRGCSYDNILYLAENDKLCEFVRSHNLCLVTSRRALLIDINNKDLMENKYGAICNVIVDEVQNFKDRDGDWYSLAEKLANQKPSNFSNHSQRCCNYFWLFMDYSQKVHKFKAGLPSVIGKNNFMLSEVSRSTKEIFDFTSRLMMASENVDGLCSPLMQHVHSTPVLAHNFSSGKGVDILSCKEAEIKMLLSKVMAGLLQNGVHENDIAILVGRRTELGKLQSAMKDIHLSETSPDKEHAGKTKEVVDKDLDLKTSRSIEKHLQECGSSSKILMVKPGTTERTSSASDDDDDGGGDRDDVDQDDDVNEGEDDALEISNQFDVLSSSSSGEQIAGNYDTPEDSMNACGDGDRNRNVKFYAQNSMQESEDGNAIEETEVPVVDNSNKTEFKTGVSVDTVRRFSGLDKAAVIGINPRVNEEHADFNKFILSLATRARDNLVIITTSDDVREQLEQFKSPPSKYA